MVAHHWLGQLYVNLTATFVSLHPFASALLDFYVTSLSGADILGSKWLADIYAMFDFKSSTVRVSLPLPTVQPTATAQPTATVPVPVPVPVPTAPNVSKVNIDRSLPPTSPTPCQDLPSPFVPVIRYSLSRHRLRCRTNVHRSYSKSIPLKLPRAGGFQPKILVAH